MICKHLQDLPDENTRHKDCTRLETVICCIRDYPFPLLVMLEFPRHV